MRDQTEPGSDIVDLQDVINRYDEIIATPVDEREEWDEDFMAAVFELKEQLFAPLGDYARNEPTMIVDSYFEEYAQELAVELGFIDRNNIDEWPCSCIDWEDAAEQLKNDYTEVTFGGYTYYVRAW
jgi:hypothetical protein